MFDDGSDVSRNVSVADVGSRNAFGSAVLRFVTVSICRWVDGRHDPLLFTCSQLFGSSSGILIRVDNVY